MFKELEKRINYAFKDMELLKTALSHRSLKKIENYERLEFLGDAVLSLVAAEFFFNCQTSLQEGHLSKLRAQYVCKENISEHALKIKLFDFIRCESSMKKSGMHKSTSVMCDALEALFGAVFIDSSLLEAKSVIFHVMGEPSLKLIEHEKDAKTVLQEYCQETFSKTPFYKVINLLGPVHDPQFEMGVYLGDDFLEKSCGKTKKEAAQKAASKALQKMTSKK